MDIQKLAGIIPASVINEIPDIMDKFGINTPLRLSHFLSQAAHESGDFRITQENLNYSADGLKAIFGKYFPGTLNESYARQPVKIANRAYANRNGNGDEASGDGWKYHGRGYIQLTGKVNYQSFSKSINVDCVTNPDLVATTYPLSSAAWFFGMRGINKVSDQGSSEDVVKEVTKLVNGQYLGLPDRLSWFNKIYNILAS